MGLKAAENFVQRPSEEGMNKVVKKMNMQTLFT